MSAVCTALPSGSQFPQPPNDRTKVPFPRTRQLLIVAALSAWRVSCPCGRSLQRWRVWFCAAAADPQHPAQLKTRYPVAELAYEYAFVRGEHYELAGSLGIHDLTFKLKLTAIGQAVNQQESARADVNGLLPVIGVPLRVGVPPTVESRCDVPVLHVEV